MKNFNVKNFSNIKKGNLYYRFFVNNKGIVEAKENKGKNIYDSIYGKITIDDFIKIKKQKNENNNK